MTKLLRLFFVVLLITLSSTACGLPDPSGKPDFPVVGLITAQELPDGFVRREYVTENVPNAEGLAIGFVVPDGSKFPPVRVSHYLSVYADEKSAQAEYPAREKEEFPVDEWKTPDGFHFKPTDSGDLYRFACVPGYFNGTDLLMCRYIQQHDNKISQVLANLDGQHLKMEDMERILKSVDGRLLIAK